MAFFKIYPEDVFEARSVLRSRKLPMELVLRILDEARYWVETEYSNEQHVVLIDEHGDENYSAALPYLSFPAWAQGESSQTGGESQQIKEIEFMVVSHGE